MNKEIIQALFPEKYQLIEKGQCPSCSEYIDFDSDFEENSPAFKEYLISGLCLQCQSKIFNNE